MIRNEFYTRVTLPEKRQAKETTRYRCVSNDALLAILIY